MHVGYTIVVGGGLARYASLPVARLAGVALFPLFVLLVIVATGNHFVLDAVAGAAVAGVALLLALAVSGSRSQAALRRLPGPRQSRDSSQTSPR